MRTCIAMCISAYCCGLVVKPSGLLKENHMKKLLCRAMAIGALITVGLGIPQGKADSGNKVTVCHMPIAKILSIPEEAVHSHFAHGDFFASGSPGSTCEIV